MSTAEPVHRRFVPAARMAGASPGMMLLILLPAWLALGILQLPLGSAQVRTLMPPLQLPCSIPWGLLGTHPSYPSTLSLPWDCLGESVVGLFPHSSEMVLSPPGAPELLLSIQVPGQDWVEGLRLEQIRRQGQSLCWDGVEGALPGPGHPNQAQRCCLLGRVPPRLREGRGGARRLTRMSLCPLRNA